MTTETTDTSVPTSRLDGAIKAYPKEWLYVKTAIFLAVLTLIEVATYMWPKFALWHWGDTDTHGVTILLLILLAIKFFTVAYIFMHLRFDKPILTRVFYAGLGTAVLVYIAVMTILNLWSPGHPHP